MLYIRNVTQFRIAALETALIEVKMNSNNEIERL
jgi:hypothetical protein